VPLTSSEKRQRLDHHVRHRDVTGGWLRPAVFGVSDGLVSNLSLVAGVSGADASSRVVLLAGLAGLFAGAFSMATGEFVSVRSQQELADAEIALERAELARVPEAEEAELAAIYRGRGLTPDLARQVAHELSRDPEVAWRVHAREELGIDPDDLPSPWTAAVASFIAFALGALVPLLAYLIDLGDSSFVVAAVASAVSLFAVGAFVSRFTGRSLWFSGARQLVLGAVAAVVTFGVGTAVGIGAA
jgi:VIT1/CCC1 family predicted Fe2+/Mn2+ transporter